MPHVKYIFVHFFLILTLLFSYSALPKTSGHLAKPRLPVNFLKVPLVRQATTYSCGAAALLAVLAYWRVYDGGESSLYQELNTTPEEGTDPLNMQKYALKLNLKAELLVDQTLDDLEASLNKGIPAIVDFQAWPEDVQGRVKNLLTDRDWEKEWESGHYAVLVTMDESYLYFMDPSTMGGYTYIPRKEFPARWHDYENRAGARVENIHMALYISGRQPLNSFPAKLQKIE